jgi:hypothetical protein
MALIFMKKLLTLFVSMFAAVAMASIYTGTFIGPLQGTATNANHAASATTAANLASITNQNVFFVSQSGSNGFTGRSWATAFRDIAFCATNYATSNATIRVDVGTYNINLSGYLAFGKNVSLIGSGNGTGGTHILGVPGHNVGFSGTFLAQNFKLEGGFIVVENDPADISILDNVEAGDGFDNSTTNGADALKCTILNGLTIINNCYLHSAEDVIYVSGQSVTNGQPRAILIVKDTRLTFSRGPTLPDWMDAYFIGGNYWETNLLHTGAAVFNPGVLTTVSVRGVNIIPTGPLLPTNGTVGCIISANNSSFQGVTTPLGIIGNLISPITNVLLVYTNVSMNVTNITVAGAGTTAANGGYTLKFISLFGGLNGLTWAKWTNSAGGFVSWNDTAASTVQLGAYAFLVCDNQTNILYDGGYSYGIMDLNLPFFSSSWSSDAGADPAPSVLFNTTTNLFVNSTLSPAIQNMGPITGNGSGLTNISTVYTTNTTYTIAPSGLTAALALFAVQTNQVITTRTP